MYCRQGILAELILWFDFFIDISGPKLCAKLIINKNDLLFSICSFMTLRKGLTLGWSNIDFFLNIQIISADIIFFGREIWILKFTKNQTSDSDPRYFKHKKSFCNAFSTPKGMSMLIIFMIGDQLVTSIPYLHNLMYCHLKSYSCTSSGTRILPESQNLWQYPSTTASTGINL